jgi:hypothetical protein
VKFTENDQPVISRGDGHFPLSSMISELNNGDFSALTAVGAELKLSQAARRLQDTKAGEPGFFSHRFVPLMEIFHACEAEMGHFPKT